MQLLQGVHLALGDLGRALDKPDLFTPGCEPFWDHPHISRQMLKAHLDQETEAASRNLRVIAAEVEHLTEYLGLGEGTSVLDLGCGPGLYATRLAERGCSVTGVDCSRTSIRHARKRAGELGLEASYRCDDFCNLDDRGVFDAALIIYGQLGALTDHDRDLLLTRVHRALKPGGHLVFDVITDCGQSSRDGDRSWRLAPEGGFWRPGPHLVLETTFHYPEADAHLDQYAVIEEDGRICVYRIWERCYCRDSITDLLLRFGFDVEEVWGDLSGNPRTEGDAWLAVAARRIR